MPVETIRAQLDAKVANLRALAEARKAAEEAERERIMRPETRAARERFERLIAEDREQAEALRLSGPAREDGE